MTNGNDGAVQRLREAREKIEQQLSQVIVGQQHVVEELLITLFARGHCLLEGVPGLAKTLMISTLAKTLNLSFNRIQFTPDLMPADITGTEIIEENRSTGARERRFLEGPLFANIILADEINRTPPKTQAALLEAMQERQVTTGLVRRPMADPFFVLATQNPIEQEGTYPLPEAQLDRFMFKLVVGYSSREDLNTIVDRTTKGHHEEPQKVMDGSEIVQWQALIREVILAKHVQDYVVRLVLATHPDGPFALEITNQYLRWGASPRGAQTLALAAKLRALLEGRFNVSFEDVRRVYLPAMRHRVILNFEAQAEGVEADQVLLDILEKLPEKADEAITAQVAS
ncbi:MAG: AAA family ATPase [Planctomycetales bacterium]|nr:AAA family ATPase [Planctomycetales bacterium]